MSAAHSQSSATTKRARQAHTEADAEATAADSGERSVRQRRSPAASSVLSAAAASSSATAASSPSSLAPPLSLMRLAVVERQLIMQALDLTSLSRLASTCSQLRAEAMHREAGKLIPEPDEESALYGACRIDRLHPAHASPLFRAHAPVTLCFVPELETEAELDSLMDKAATFSRITTLISWGIPWWTDERRIRLLSSPCMQEVRAVDLDLPHWLASPRVQTALFSLPRLTSLHMLAGPTLKLLPSAVASAAKLSTLSVQMERESTASVRALSALRRAPALASLELDFDSDTLDPAAPVLAELVWCLTPTLTHLGLRQLDVPHDLSRPLAKALFSRTPLLESVQLSGSIETVLRGLMDAGVRALPLLRRVRFDDVFPADFAIDEDQDQDPIRPLLRRFLHRFPEVTVQLFLDADAGDDPDQLSAVQVRYLRWPRIELYRAGSADRIGEPPSPHPSDDECGSDVEDLSDPGLGSEERGN